MSKRRYLIGLTGSMGMGKSTTAQMFRDEGIPVWDADETVHRMYEKGGAAVARIGEICPQAVVAGAVDRDQLKQWISKDPSALSRIEAIVHPLLAHDREAFLAGIETDIAVLDFPLLLESGANALVDLVVVVTAPETLQRKRILQRGTMDEAMLDTILAKQMPDKEKRALADVVIETLDMETARQAVRNLLQEIRQNA